jgi:hypothetical protein
MRRIITWLIALGVIGAIIWGGRSLFANRKKAALSVNATPKSTIFLDGEHLGQTPFVNENLKAGEYILKIVPESSGQALSPWEGRVTLVPGIMTAVNRELGLTQDTSSGEILSFELIADKNAASMAVVTTPDGAVVSLDGEPKGFAPLSLDGLTEGEHTLTVSSPGYKEKVVKARLVKGHKLIASLQLAREAVVVTPETDQQEATASGTTISASPSPSPRASASPSPKATTPVSTLEKPYVEIKSEATGWVRVRKEPSTASEEVTKVDHGDQFPLLDSQNGWYEIEYETGSSGWISGQYAEKYE